MISLLIAVVVYVVWLGLCECGWRLARVIVVEGGHYFPFEDVNMEFLDESPTHAVCSWKRKPSSYTILLD
jgi:uncharacterized protein (DUF427 family)